MTGKRILQVGAILLWALFAAPGQQVAAAQDTEAFRQDVAAALDEWMDLIDTLQANPVAAETMAGRGTHALALLAEAQWVLLNATAEELAPLQVVMEAAPGWQDWPSQLRPIVAKFTVADDGVSINLVPDVCSVAIFLDITVTDRAIAEAAALALEALMEALPTDGITIALRLIPIGLWAAGEALAITATANNDVKENCNGDAALAAIQSGVGAVQISVNAVQTSLAAHDVNIDADLAAHDADIKALLATINGGIVQNRLLLEEVINLLLTPQGRRDGFPLN